MTWDFAPATPHPSGFLFSPLDLSSQAASRQEHLCHYMIVRIVALLMVVAVILTKSFCDSHLGNKYNYQ